MIDGAIQMNVPLGIESMFHPVPSRSAIHTLLLTIVVGTTTGTKIGTGIEIETGIEIGETGTQRTVHQEEERMKETASGTDMTEGEIRTSHMMIGEAANRHPRGA